MASISTTIFDELLTTIEKIGVDRTVKILQEAKLKSVLLNDMNIEFVLNTVSEVTSVSRDTILNGVIRNDERKIAIALCVYFIKSEFSYSYPEMAKIFNKDASQLSRYNTIVECTEPLSKIDFDKKLLGYFKKIKLLITEKKLNNGK